VQHDASFEQRREAETTASLILRAPRLAPVTSSTGPPEGNPSFARAAFGSMAKNSPRTGYPTTRLLAAVVNARSEVVNTGRQSREQPHRPTRRHLADRHERAPK
jgi:hypothetical protein